MKEIMEKVIEMMHPYNVYAVGGCVRDYVMKIKPHDYDFTTNAKPDEIQDKIQNSGRRAYMTGKKYGTLGCKIDRQMIEITTYRGEEYKPNCRKPRVEYLTNLNADLDRRDFTINAMAMKLQNGRFRIIDNHGGREDIKNSVIRCVGNSKIRFKEDPLRILRAIRFATRFEYSIEERTADRLHKMSPLLLTLSKERWIQEIDKILMDDNVTQGLIDLWVYDIFRFTIPELHLQRNYNQNSKYHSHKLWIHTMNVIELTPKDIILRWGALLHDIAKPFVCRKNLKTGYNNFIDHEKLGADMVEKLGRHLHWSNERREAVVDLVANHLNEDSPLKKYDDAGK